MTEVVHDVSSLVEQLSDRVAELERRVAELETPRQAAAPQQPALIFGPLEMPKPSATRRGFPPTERPARVVPVLGKAVLAIAGAYLLRAIAELSAVPKLPVLFIAIFYAFSWLIGGTKTAGTTIREFRLRNNVSFDPLALVVGIHGSLSGALAGNIGDRACSLCCLEPWDLVAA